jgi:hypothetical protein
LKGVEGGRVGIESEARDGVGGEKHVYAGVKRKSSRNGVHDADGVVLYGDQSTNLAVEVAAAAREDVLRAQDAVEQFVRERADE